MLLSGIHCNEPEVNNIETEAKGIFSELGCIMQKSSVFAKISCPGLCDNVRDLVIILSKNNQEIASEFFNSF